MAFVEFRNVGKTYHMGEVDINALHDATFEVEKGELATEIIKSKTLPSKDGSLFC